MKQISSSNPLLPLLLLQLVYFYEIHFTSVHISYTLNLLNTCSKIRIVAIYVTADIKTILLTLFVYRFMIYLLTLFYVTVSNRSSPPNLWIKKVLPRRSFLFYALKYYLKHEFRKVKPRVRATLT